MSLDDAFVKDVGQRIRNFLESKSKNPRELRAMQAAVITHFDQILDTAAVEAILDEARLSAEIALAEDIRGRIASDKQRLANLETSISKRQRRSESELDQSQLDVANQNQFDQVELHPANHSELNVGNSALENSQFDDGNDELFSQLNFTEEQ